MSDAIDTIVAQWRRERPDLDLSKLATFGRLGQAAGLLRPAVDAVLARHGLRQGEFDVLAALRGAGTPYTMIPSTLAATLMMSRAGMTNRLDRLENAGLVERRLDPNDRRSFLIALTARGRTVVDATLADHAANLRHLLSGLNPAERRALDDSLRALLHHLT